MTTNIVDKDGKSIEASSATVPSDRHFRNAWSLSGTTITEDVTAAKVIFKNKIREVRKDLLEAQDVACRVVLIREPPNGVPPSSR